jgi:hypothetical protein
MKDELLDIIDEDNRVIGQASKSAVHRQGLRHRVGAVLLRREDGKYLIPTASGIKAEAGRLYHSAAGHVLSGESCEECAKRELVSLPLKTTCKTIFKMNEVNMSESLKVYFGCSMRGGYANVKREDLAEFPKMIVGLGHRLATDHQTQPGILEKEAQFEHVYIHDRDYRWMMESDLGVFEISNPSLGVGGEISDMIHIGKPVLLLFKKSSEEKVSAYIKGKCGSSFVNSPIECAAYEDLKEARELIRRFIALCRASF